jgi:hypothetical protein
MKFITALVLAVLVALPAYAQTTTTFRAVVGQPLIAEVDLPPDAVGQTGISSQLKFFIDGSFQPSVVYGAPAGTTRTVQFAVPPAPISTAKTYLLSIALSYTITDQTKWTCGGTGIGTTTPAGLVCPDVFATNNVSLVLDPPPAPIPNPAPTNFRLRLKPVSSGTGVGLEVELEFDDGTIIREIVPVVADYRGRVTLALPSLIER